MSEQRKPYWVPYNPPPATWTDSLQDWLRAYGFIPALIASVILFVSVMWTSSHDDHTNAGDSSGTVAAFAATTHVDEGDSSSGVAELYIFTEPRGATVSINNKDELQIPLLRYELAAGEHQLVITREGYLTIDTMVVLRGNRAELFSFELASEPVRRRVNRPSVARSFPVETEQFEAPRMDPQSRIEELAGELGLADTIQVSDRSRALRNRIGW